MVKPETKVRYVSLWNKIKTHNVDLSQLESMTPLEFNKSIGSKGTSDGQYKLAKSLARNIERQEDVNEYIEDRKISPSIIPKITPREYIEPYSPKREVESLDFSQDTSDFEPEEDYMDYDYNIEDDYDDMPEDIQDQSSPDDMDNDGSPDPEYERLRVWLEDYFPTRRDAGKDVEKAFRKEIKNWDSLSKDTRQGLITDWTNFINSTEGAK